MIKIHTLDKSFFVRTWVNKSCIFDDKRFQQASNWQLKMKNHQNIKQFINTILKNGNRTKTLAVNHKNYTTNFKVNY